MEHDGRSGAGFSSWQGTPDPPALVEERTSWMLWGFLVAHWKALAVGVAAALLALAVSVSVQGENQPPLAPLTTTTVTRSLGGVESQVWGILEAVPRRLPGADTGGPSRVVKPTAPPAADPVRGAAEPAPDTQAVIRAPRWEPEDECADVDTSRLRSRSRSRTMRWCPKVAYYLYQGQVLGAWRWERGDLTRLMAIIACESNGNPSDQHPGSKATGLFQHLMRYWDERAPKAARLFGFDNPDIWMPYDNIAVGVWLYKTGGRQHWPNCGRW